MTENATLSSEFKPLRKRSVSFAGANDYIPKPVDMDRLLSTMRVWLKNEY